MDKFDDDSLPAYLRDLARLLLEGKPYPVGLSAKMLQAAADRLEELQQREIDAPFRDGFRYRD